MKRLTKYKYKVKQNDKITFRVTPLNGATGRVTGACNGKRLVNKGSVTSPRFEIKADEFPGNSHFTKLEFTFLTGAPRAAEYELKLEIKRGTRKKSWSDFPNIKKKNKTRERNLRFLVA